MSQHIIDEKDHLHFIRLGFDPGLNTFYAQVVDRELHRLAEEAGARVDEAISRGRDCDPADASAADAETIIHWAGTTPDEITSVEDLAHALQRYVKLSAELRARLLEDMKREAHPPTHLQSKIRRLMTDSSKAQDRPDKK